MLIKLFFLPLILSQNVQENLLHTDQLSGRDFYVNTNGYAQFYNKILKKNVGEPQIQQWQTDIFDNHYLFLPNGDRQYYDVKSMTPIPTPDNAEITGFMSIHNPNGTYSNCFYIKDANTKQIFVIQDDDGFMQIYYDDTGALGTKQKSLVFTRDGNEYIFSSKGVHWYIKSNTLTGSKFVIIDDDFRIKPYDPISGELGATRIQSWQLDEYGKSYIYSNRGQFLRIQTDSDSNYYIIDEWNDWKTRYVDKYEGVSPTYQTQTWKADPTGKKYWFKADGTALYLIDDKYIVDHVGDAQYWDETKGGLQPPVKQPYKPDIDAGVFFIYNYDGSKKYKIESSNIAFWIVLKFRH